MIDLEQLTQIFEACISDDNDCRACPMFNKEIGWCTGSEILTVPREIVNDVLVILKAQKPVKPIWESGLWLCGACGSEVDRYDGDRYCPNCGRAVKWE